MRITGRGKTKYKASKQHRHKVPHKAVNAGAPLRSYAREGIGNTVFAPRLPRARSSVTGRTYFGWVGAHTSLGGCTPWGQSAPPVNSILQGEAATPHERNIPRDCIAPLKHRPACSRSLQSCGNCKIRRHPIWPSNMKSGLTSYTNNHW